MDIDTAAKLAEKLRILIETEVEKTEIPNFTCSFGVVFLTEFNSLVKHIGRLMTYCTGQKRVVGTKLSVMI